MTKRAAWDSWPSREIIFVIWGDGSVVVMGTLSTMYKLHTPMAVKWQMGNGPKVPNDQLTSVSLPDPFCR